MERGGLEKWKGWILRLARAQRKQLAGDVDTGRGRGEKSSFSYPGKASGPCLLGWVPFLLYRFLLSSLKSRPVCSFLSHRVPQSRVLIQAKFSI